ncbi:MULTISPECIES: STAS domain-containing protein [Pseudonocardia]|uniref:Anti-sigma factor antagonist n=1 Tax=Pseudonocardia oroxyli TaxID=366584 RepID=A0A1G7VK18_PSEOR|nr:MULTISPECIES: STAS domain-containing protein [Pseudonocardia]MCF7553353.1 STAS domain-containing protein [Pseudonocardia sp. WMMC193]SDG60192.1 anti-anti-sigma factor [Pseudonocardia oroxyli]
MSETPADEGGVEISDVVRFEQAGDGSSLVAHVRGEIDTLTAPLLRTELDARLPAAPLVVLDLSGVTFLGSAGLAVLVAAKDQVDRSGHSLKLVCGSRIVTRALQATGLLGLFDVADGVTEALSS